MAQQKENKSDKRKRKKQGAAAIAAVGKDSIFSRPGQHAGKVRVSETVSLSQDAKGDGSGGSGRRITRDSDSFSPSDRARERSSDDGPQLGRALAQIASGVSPGRGKIGAALSGGISGAAIGANVGEALAKDSARRKKKKNGRAKS